ncbi:hypothetical protein D3C87_2032200 [compost metagenome]
MHVEQHLRMGVKIAAPGGNLGLKLGNAVKDRHKNSEADWDGAMSLPADVASTPQRDQAA